MTISTTASTVTAAGNGATLAFNFSFVYDSASNIVVTFTDATGVATVLAQGSQYTLALNPAAAGQVWGVGGTVTYPLSGAPIPAGTYLTITRVLPLTQLITLANQGAFYPQVVEKALDILEMQNQQLASVSTRAITINPVDPGPAVPLPPAAIRANQYAFFDAQGNLTAGLPASSSAIISAAMQPVVAASSLSTARALLGTLGTFGTIASLRANATTQPAVIYLTGYHTLADGGEGIFELVASDTTSADNGGTIIVDADGNRWYRALGGQPLTVQMFGGKGDGTTDNLAAWAALAAVAVTFSNGASVLFPPGKYLFSGNAAFNFPASRAFHLHLEGYGATLFWPGSGGGLTFAKVLAGQQISLSGMHITTGVADGGSGIFVSQTDPLLEFFQDVFTGVVFRGDDNNGHSGAAFYWTNGAAISNNSGTAWYGCTFYGGNPNGTPVGVGINFQGTGAGGPSGPNYSIYHNINSGIFNLLGVGVQYNSYAQGLTIVQSNFQNSQDGFLVPSGAGGELSQLQISESQFACKSNQITCLEAIGNVMIANNDIFGVAGQSCIFLQSSNGYTITGNTIAVTSPTDSFGITVANNTFGFPSTITGNGINGANVGIFLDTGSSATIVSGNAIANCTTPVDDIGTGNIVANNLGLPPATQGVSGGASPWTFTNGNRPATLWMSATTSITAIALASGGPILPAATAANQTVSVPLAPHMAVTVTYTGTISTFSIMT